MRPTGPAQAAPVLMVFAKPPLPGVAKTRLRPLLGAVGAARLQGRMIYATLCKAQRSRWERVELHTALAGHHPFFLSCRRRLGVVLRSQAMGDLGRRMDRALAGALAKAPFALLIGTDCPGCTSTDLDLAYALLAQGTDAVLGPVRDGGYWLIGLPRPAPFLFRDMPWGGARVLSLSRNRLARRGWSWRELPLREDLDGPNDWRRWKREMTRGWADPRL